MRYPNVARLIAVISLDAQDNQLDAIDVALQQMTDAEMMDFVYGNESQMNAVLNKYDLPFNLMMLMDAMLTFGNPFEDTEPSEKLH